MAWNDGKRDVTVLGLGTMGARCRRPARRRGPGDGVEPLAGPGRRPGGAGRDRGGHGGGGGAASATVVACLLDHASVHEVLDPVADRLAGRVLVELTNGTPAQARELAEWARRHGDRAARRRDHGGAADDRDAERRSCSTAGPRTVFDAHRPVLDLLGESVFAGARPGRAALLDLALLSAMYGMFGGVLHAFALAGSGGVAAREFAPLLDRWLAAMGGFADGAAEQIDSGDYARRGRLEPGNAGRGLPGPGRGAPGPRASTRR